MAWAGWVVCTYSDREVMSGSRRRVLRADNHVVRRTSRESQAIAITMTETSQPAAVLPLVTVMTFGTVLLWLFVGPLALAGTAFWCVLAAATEAFSEPSTPDSR
jgi:hypothetical protein